MSCSWRCQRIKPSRCLQPSTYLSALSLCPPTFSLLSLSSSSSCLSFFRATHHHTPLWVLTPVWCMPLFFSRRSLGAHGRPINHSHGPLFPAELSQSQVIGFKLNVMCQGVNEGVHECVGMHMMLCACLGATVRPDWSNLSCKPTADTHSYLQTNKLFSICWEYACGMFSPTCAIKSANADRCVITIPTHAHP